MGLRGGGSSDGVGTVDQVVSERMWHHGRAGSDCICPGGNAVPRCACRQKAACGRNAVVGSSSLSSSCCGKEQGALMAPSYPGGYYREAAGPRFGKLHRKATGFWRSRVGFTTNGRVVPPANLPVFSVPVP